MGCPPGSDNGAILGEVDVPVDVAVAVGESIPLGLCGALFSSGASFIFPVYQQLNSLLSSKLRGRQGVNVNIQSFQRICIGFTEKETQKCKHTSKKTMQTDDMYTGC